MSTSSFDDLYDQLLESLDETIQLLRRYSKGPWAERLVGVRAKIADGDRYALKQLLSSFGGMGSFNDLVIHPLNGDPIDEADIGTVNRALTDYRNRIWTAAKAMERDLNHSDQ